MASVPRATLLLARLSAAFTLLTVSLGSVVCATKSGFDCHSWPGCYPDRFAPGAGDIPAILAANPALEMVHRVTAMSTGAVLVITALLTLRLVGQGRLVKVLPWVAVAAAGGSALFGRAAVLGLGVDATGAAIDLLFALIAMTVSALTAIALPRGGRLRLTPASGPAALAASLLIVMHVTGQLAAGNRSFTRCMSWPVLWLASDDNLLVQVLRTGLALAAAVALLVAVRTGLRTPAVRLHSLVVAGLLAGVLVLAVAYRASGTDGGVLGVTFSLTSVALLWATITLAGRARRTTLPGAGTRARARSIAA
jgi:heme a synthase